MRYDEAKVEETVLALLGVFEFDEGRVWKRIDFGVMDSGRHFGLVQERQAKLTR
jgi:hypothetical protein